MPAQAGAGPYSLPQINKNSIMEIDGPESIHGVPEVPVWTISGAEEGPVILRYIVETAD